MVSRCFGEEKGKAGKRESGVDLGGGIAALYFVGFPYRPPPKWVVHPGYLLTLSYTVFISKWYEYNID